MKFNTPDRLSPAPDGSNDLFDQFSKFGERRLFFIQKFVTVIDTANAADDMAEESLTHQHF
jgi:hypothetical protein